MTKSILLNSTRLDNKALSNKILLVTGLSIIRLPIVFGLNDNPWAILCTTLPFWLVIVNNHLPDIVLPIKLPKFINRLVLNISLVINLLAGFLLISGLFIYLVKHNTQSPILLLPIIYGVLVSILFVGGLAKIIDGCRIDKKLLFLGLSFYLITMFGIIRTSTETPFLLIRLFQVITILYFCFSSKVELFRKKDLFIWYLYLGLVIYIGINLILLLGGVNNPYVLNLKVSKSVMYSLIGITSPRIHFPLAEGINSFGYVGGAGLVMSAAYFLNDIYEKKRILYRYVITSIGGLISGLVILSADSRGSMLIAVIVLSLLVVRSLVLNKAVYTVIVLSQNVIFLLLKYIKGNIPIITRLARENSDVLSGRGDIWQAGIEYLLNFKWIHLIGYGTSGHKISGVVYKYTYTIGNYINKTRANTTVSLHHFGLQTIFDNGYIGLLIAYSLFLYLGYRTILIIQKDTSLSGFYALYALIIFFIFVGMIEAIPTFYSVEIFFLLPFVISALVLNNIDFYDRKKTN